MGRAKPSELWIDSAGYSGSILCCAWVIRHPCGAYTEGGKEYKRKASARAAAHRWAKRYGIELEESKP